MNDNVIADKDRIDAMASRLAREIMEKPNKGQSEYVAVIFVDDSGQLKSSTLHSSGDFSRAPLGRAMQEAPDRSSIVAIVHSHPQGLVDASRAPEISAQVEKCPPTMTGASHARTLPAGRI